METKSDIANVMNKQFSEMGAKLAEKLDNTEANFLDYLKFPNPNRDRMILYLITEPEVVKLIMELDTTKSIGIDEISPKLLKWASAVLAPILTRLFNKCLVAGVYPDSFKIARVKPIQRR